MITDFEKALAVFTQHQIEFIVIGGVAGTLHGSAFMTQDLDVVYSRAPENIRRLAAALQPHSPYLREAPPGLPFKWDEQTIRNGLNFTLTTAFGDLDLLGEVIGGGTYNDLLAHSKEVSGFGVRFRLVDLDKLIVFEARSRTPQRLAHRCRTPRDIGTTKEAASKITMNNSLFHRMIGDSPALTRREFLWRSGGGLGGIALTSLLGRDALLKAAEPDHAPRIKQHAPLPHHPPRAKRVIQMFMAGAASHIDLFDFKAELVKRDGQKSDFGEHVEAFQDGLGPWMKPIWDFKPYGRCGKLLSDIVADLGPAVDDIAFVHNLVGKTGVHSQATYLQATGFQLPGFPGMGCWVSYGLGSSNENLPAFVVLPDHRGFASNGPKNWDSAFLPPQHAGTTIYPGRENPIQDLFADKRGDFISVRSESAAHALLAQLNRQHAATREDDARLDARIRSYELAARMQLAAPEALDISREPDYVLDAYGIDRSTKTWPKEINAREEMDYFGRKCLAARRLVERGVRFVQIWSGNDNAFPRRNWDSHEDVRRDHEPLARGFARGASALIQDLKQRGLLDDTVILWTTEFGRMPSSQGGKGRDHNPFCFTNWLCGGGIRGGIAHGESDPWGYKPLDRNHPTTVYDIHATVLHLLGIDHEKLTFRHGGIDRRLTDVHGEVISEILF